MTSHAPKTPPPDGPVDDDLPDEQSSVRERIAPSAPPQSAPQRLELLVRRAKLLVAAMPADNPRSRLLQIAMMRRDETLLERLLDEASSAVGVVRPSTPPDR